MATALVFLVPGFFGFTSLGSVSYFERVEHFLHAALARRGLQARIVRCATQPTASIPRRADLLRRQVLRHGWTTGSAATKARWTALPPACCGASARTAAIPSGSTCARSSMTRARCCN